MIQVDKTRCVGCATCVADCISGVLSVEEGTAQVSGPCLQCGHCVALCPHGAISIPNYSDPCIAYDPETFDLPTQTVLNALKFRRSVRHFKEELVSYEHLHLLMDAAAHTATAKNQQACRFTFIQDSLDDFKGMVWRELEQRYESGEQAPLLRETLERFFELRQGKPAQDYLFRNAPAVLCIQAPDPVDAGLAAQAIELVASTLSLGVLYNGYLRRTIVGLPSAQERLDMDLEEKPLVVCMLLGYSDVRYLRTAPRRNPSVVLR